jgi:hypothetical protein
MPAGFHLFTSFIALDDTLAGMEVSPDFNEIKT